jgi:hypothetical protein
MVWKLQFVVRFVGLFSEPLRWGRGKKSPLKRLSFVLLVIPRLYSIPDDLGWTTKVEAEEAHA